MEKQDKVGRYKLFHQSGIPKILGKIKKSEAVAKARAAGPGTTLVEITEKQGGIVVDLPTE